MKIDKGIGGFFRKNLETRNKTEAYNTVSNLNKSQKKYHAPIINPNLNPISYGGGRIPPPLQGNAIYSKFYLRKWLYY